MKWPRFGIRHLLIGMTALAIPIIVFQEIARKSPMMFAILCVYLLVLAIMGVGIMALAGMIASSVYARQAPDKRSEYLARCTNLAKIGGFLIIPAIIAIIVALVMRPKL